MDQREGPPSPRYNADVCPVAIVENTAADRCKLAGLYELRIGSVALSLHNITTKQLIYTWPYKHIRRYGRSSNNLQFEAGRKCPSGEGLFSLITEEGTGEMLFARMSKRFDEIRRKKSLTSQESSSDCSSSSGSSTESDCESPVYEEAPALPPRNYKTDTLQSLFSKRMANMKKVPKLKMSKGNKELPSSKSTQESHYAEIDLVSEDVTPKTTAASASFINSLIKRHKDTLLGKPSKSKQKKSTPNSNNNNTASTAEEEEGVYHVLHDNRNKLPTEDFYSELNVS